MVSINYAFKEIISKIVYYGPGLSGKTTNLQYVFKKVPSETRGELISLATDADRTLYFDFLPVNVGTIKGFATKFQLYTVPGQVYYNATRKLVLRGVDGLVFVADSQTDKMDENIESLQNLKDNLEEYGYDIGQIPMVIQYNKRDLPKIASLEELERLLNPGGLPYFEAVAVSGDGVFKTLKAISKMVLDQVKEKRMEPAKTVKPQPVETPVPAPVGAIASETVAASPIERAAAQITAEKASVTMEETSVVQIADQEEKIGTRKISITEDGSVTQATVVVSDSQDESRNLREDNGIGDNNEESVEKAVLADDPPEPVIEEPISPPKTHTRHPHVEEDSQEILARAGKGYTIDDSLEDASGFSVIDIKSPLPLGKPQMAESRKVKGKKGGFSLFGWLKK